MLGEMPREFQEGNVFFAHAVEDPDRADPFAGQANDLAPGAAEFSQHGLHLLDRPVKMLLEKFLEDVHDPMPGDSSPRYHRCSTLDQKSTCERNSGSQTLSRKGKKRAGEAGSQRSLRNSSATSAVKKGISPQTASQSSLRNSRSPQTQR